MKKFGFRIDMVHEVCYNKNNRKQHLNFMWILA